MFVIATAGHVDHGKSTLVRALTGMEPDRWAEERRRGMTIDLGYAWTTLPQGPTLAFVDVPGHERFIGNMLAGLGPVPAVLMVVGADEGWREQSAEHLAAIDALGLQHGLLAVTRSDLADPAVAEAAALQHIADSSLGQVRAVRVSGLTEMGLPELRSALASMVAELPTPRTDGRVRLWVDRSFTIRGSGTVVTGTLGAGALEVGDTLQWAGGQARIRALQSLGRSLDRVEAVARVAVNLRGVPPEALTRGTALLTPGGWTPTSVVEARTRTPTDSLPSRAVVHLGSGAFPVTIRPLAPNVVRLTLSSPLPLEPGDRGILRDPGKGRLAGGFVVLDTAPPALRLRGSAARRGAELAAHAAAPPLVEQVRRRGAVRAAELRLLGVDPDQPAEVLRRNGWLIDPGIFSRWVTQLSAQVKQHDERTPMNPGLPSPVAARSIGLPDVTLLPDIAQQAGLSVVDGKVGRPGVRPLLGAAEAGIAQLEKRLAADPFAAPERGDLQSVRIGRAELAAAEAAGRVLRLTDDLVLLPGAPALARKILGGLPQPFTTSAARAALGTTRRVAIPLLEHLDKLGWTRQLQPGSRVLVDE